MNITGGFVDYRDKIIMDLGADFGSTAECFLQKGALKVICVEGDEQYYINLESYCQTTNGKAVPIKKWINNTRTLAEVFHLFKQDKSLNIDIMKIDIEGEEINIVKLPRNMTMEIKEYIIETHSCHIKNRIISRFRSLGYNLILERQLAVPGVNVVYFKRRDK